MRLYTRLKEILNEPVYQVAIILFLFEAAFVSTVAHPVDGWAFKVWCQYIFAHGIGNIYSAVEPVFNYPPLIAYPLYIFGIFEGSADWIEKYFYFFKLFGLLADFVVAIMLVKLIGDKKKEVLWLLLLVANPAFIYNSYCWGQVDGILSMFIFLSFLSLLRNRIYLSVLFFTLAINFKVHAIIFLPPLVALAVYQPGKGASLKTLFLSLLTFALTEIIILFPFLLNAQMGPIGKVIAGSIGYYNCTTCNAYNVWFFLVGKAAVWQPDTGTWLNVSYRYWGFIMFSILSFIALFPLLSAAISKVFKGRNYTIDRDSLFLIFALIPLLFFYFNTQMHERFGHTALLFTAAFVFSTRRYWLFVLICAAYFGNMEGILHFFNFPNYGVLIFDPYWVASLYLVLIICLFYFLYKPFILQLKLNYARTG